MDTYSCKLAFLTLVRGDRGGGSGQTLCSERSEFQRAERAKASEASQSSRSCT